MKFKGRIKKLMDVRSGISRIGNPWRTQDFIFEYFDNDNEQYAETALVNVRNEKIEELSLREGEEVVVDLRCTVKTYGERIYNEVYAKTVERVAQAAQAAPTAATEPTEAQKEAMKILNEMPTVKENGEQSDLPF